jgi:hypothetical protein
VDQSSELSVELVTNVTTTSLRVKYFNDSMDKSQEQLMQGRSRALERLDRAKPEGFDIRAQIGQIQKAGLFPFSPELYEPLVLGRENKVIYVSTIVYRQEKLGNLRGKLNSSKNMSLEEFNSKADDIRDSTWEDEKVQDFFANYNFSEGSGPLMGGVMVSRELTEQARTGEVKELSLVNYLPAVFTTFLLYYVVNAFVVEIGRKGYRRIKGSDDFRDRDSEDQKSRDVSPNNGF